MMYLQSAITSSVVLNFAKPKDPNVITDYQIELTAVWTDHLKTDSSGVYECSNNHDKCSRCVHHTDEENRGRRRGV